MWANAQRDGRPAEYRWRPLLNAGVWLAPTTQVPCSNVANIGERKTWTQSKFCTWQNSVMGYEPRNVYIVYPPKKRLNIVQSLVDLRWAYRRCSNEAKTRNPFNICWVSQTPEPISAANANGPKFTILCENMWRRYCCFLIVDTCFICEDTARQSCAMVHRWRIFWRFFVSCIFSEPRAAHFRAAF